MKGEVWDALQGEADAESDGEADGEAENQKTCKLVILQTIPNTKRQGGESLSSFAGGVVSVRLDRSASF